MARLYRISNTRSDCPNIQSFSGAAARRTDRMAGRIPDEMAVVPISESTPLNERVPCATIDANVKLSMTFGLAAGVTAAVVVSCAAAAYAYSRHHFESRLADARASALAQGELIRVALEHQMIENDRTLIARMIESFRAQARLEQIAVLDRNGVERFSSGGRASAAEFQHDSYAPGDRGNSRVIETRGGSILRTVIPIHNREACFRCHGPLQKINGILILDYNAGEMRAEMTRDLRWMVAGAGALALLLVGAIGFVFRVSVLRRLQRFETTARLICGGDLARRVPSEGTDTLSWLAREFNSMADSVTGLVGEVRAERERLETVINSVDDGIVVLDPGRNIIAANDAFLKRVGASRDAIPGCHCRELGATACSVGNCPAVACLANGERQVRICERRTAEGAVAWEEVHASPILDSGGHLTHIVEVWRDISERRAAEARLADSHRLASLGILASGFSHELNTPLATVLMCVEGILRDAGDDRLRDSASIAREQILRCRGITQHFLRMSRGAPGRDSVVDVAAALDSVRRLIDPTARAHSVAIHVDADTAGPIRADEAEFHNAIINLMLNAIQACRPGGRVDVSAALDRGSLRIRVSDNGCGIKAEDCKRIFEPFFSLRHEGTGLGLFLTLNFVRRCGGEIRVESTPGEGSTFELTFPALVAEPA
jgi:PAS domain S-box-containing protein